MLICLVLKGAPRSIHVEVDGILQSTPTCIDREVFSRSEPIYKYQYLAQVPCIFYRRLRLFVYSSFLDQNDKRLDRTGILQSVVKNVYMEDCQLVLYCS